MRYMNIKTGYVLVTDCKVSGADWQLVDSSVAEKKPAKDKPKRTKGEKK